MTDSTVTSPLQHAPCGFHSSGSPSLLLILYSHHSNYLFSSFHFPPCFLPLVFPSLLSVPTLTFFFSASSISTFKHSVFCFPFPCLVISLLFPHVLQSPFHASRRIISSSLRWCVLPFLMYSRGGSGGNRGEGRWGERSKAGGVKGWFTDWPIWLIGSWNNHNVKHFKVTSTTWWHIFTATRIHLLNNP